MFQLIQVSVKNQEWRSSSDSTKHSMCNDSIFVPACCGKYFADNFLILKLVNVITFDKIR